MGGLAAGMGTALLFVWNAWQAERKAFDDFRDKTQEKNEGFIKQVTELLATATSQTNTFTNSINTLVTSVATLKDETIKTLNAIQLTARGDR